MHLSMEKSYVLVLQQLGNLLLLSLSMHTISCSSPFKGRKRTEIKINGTKFHSHGLAKIKVGGRWLNEPSLWVRMSL
jgi:hypothetical protein